MTTYGYMRGSRDDIDQDNQKHSILEYANRKGLSKIQWINDTVSTRKKLEDRKIFPLIWEKAQDGDTIIVSEVSRLGRSTLEVLQIAKEALDKGVSIHVVKQSLIFDGSIQSKAYATMLGLFAEIERDFIQQRTITALAARKKEIAEKGYFISKSGNKITALGTQKGQKKKLKLEDNIEAIHDYIAKGVSIAAIAKIYGVTRNTVYKALKRHPAPKIP